MTQIQSPKRYDLETRTLQFAAQTRLFVKQIPKTLGNIEDGKQLTRSSGSVGANYIEANEPLSKKDFVMRIKICRKEAKESMYWLKLIDTGNSASLEAQKQELIGEPTQLMKIFGSIISKSV